MTVGEVCKRNKKMEERGVRRLPRSWRPESA
jgi:hypothetical protein